MIVNPLTLALVERRWTNGDPARKQVFTDVAAALEYADSQSEVRNSLRHDPSLRVMTISNHIVGQSPQIQGTVTSNGALMVAYTITEYTTYAEVEVRP